MYKADTETTKQYIDPEEFVNKMEQHWTGELENVSSLALRRAWGQIAHTFKAQIDDHDKPKGSSLWRILSPPTGSGKTESTVIYCSMLADLPDFFHPGALIVTRLISDCDNIAARINQFGSRRSAVAFHSDSKTKLEDLKGFPVVVITHRAYELALDHLGSGGRIRNTWPLFHDWTSSTRKLVVVDECLDIVEHSDASLDGLRATLGAVPYEVREKHSAAVEAVETVIDTLAKIARNKKHHENMCMPKPLEEGEPPDLTGLIEDLKGVRFDYASGRNDPAEGRRLSEMHQKRLKSLHYIFRTWFYYANKGKDHTMNTARLLVPEGVKGAVLMDATASTSVIYDLHKDSFVLNTPKGVRDYSNFTLHVSRGHKTGKTFMTKHGKKQAQGLMDSLGPKLSGKKVFIACHKNVEHHLYGHDVPFEMTSGHWGKIDGSNGWRDCDTVVIFGLPYLPDTWTANVFMALQGPQDTQWLTDPDARPYGDHVDIRKALKVGQMSTSIIQAINRIRCRKVSDSQGNCPKSEGYILLPQGKVADKILTDIRKAMPGIKVVEDWNFKAVAKRKAKTSKHGKGLEVYIQNMKPGKVSTTTLAKELGMTGRTMRNILTTMKDPDSTLSQTMKKAGARYEFSGHGRGSRSYLIKGN